MSDRLDIPPNARIVLPPHGFVALQADMASDLAVVNAARVSFAKTSDWDYFDTFADDQPSVTPEEASFLYANEGQVGTRLHTADEAVLRWLVAKRHGTPFEHTWFKFHVRAPIFVFREWHRHRIGVSINEESARYSPLAGDFYVPEGEAWRKQVGKPGRYTYEPLSEEERYQWSAQLEGAYKGCYELYEDMMEAGVAKEIARLILPVGIYSQMIWSCNARSLMNFLSLRNDPQAQREIRLYAEAMEAEFARLMPVTHDEFVKNGRRAP
jgi:thymidylate synthase (FAD)